MRNLYAITIITGLLVGMSATSLLAQSNRATRTGGAKAVYGYPTDYKAKKKKKQKKRKTPNRNNKQEPLYRKKNPWAN